MYVLKPDMDHAWVAVVALIVGIGALLVLAWWPTWRTWWTNRDRRGRTT